MQNRRLVLGEREIDLERGEVRSPKGIVSLTPNEVKLLSVLSDRPGQVVDRDELLCAALGYNKSVTSRAIDQAVWRLRRKIEDEPHEPRWLLSEANLGYRLVLSAREAEHPSVPGRKREQERIIELLQSRSSAVIVGLPGYQRRALAEAVRASHPAISQGLSVVDRMPEDPSIPAVRLGPLPQDVASVMLIGAVLSERGAASLPEEEELLVPGIVDRLGGHPGAIFAAAKRAVLLHLSELGEPEPDPRHVALLEALPGSLRGALARCAVFPDAFAPDEPGIPPEQLVELWRALMLDAVDTSGEKRRFVVPPCLRAIVVPDLDAKRAFFASVAERASELGLAALDGLEQAALDKVSRLGPRLDRALSFALPSEAARLAPALLARQIAAGVAPSVLPEPPQDGDEASLCLLLRSLAREGDDLEEARALAFAALDRARSPTPEINAIRAAFRLSLRGARPQSALEALLQRARDLAVRSPRAFHLATVRHLRGLYLLRVGSPDEAREELVASLSLYGEGSIASLLVVSNLAAEAARDGRVLEALAWSQRVPIARLAPAEEARERRRRASILAAALDLEAAEREISLAEMLGAPAPQLLVDRALIALLRGEIERAVVLAQSASGPALGVEAEFGRAMVLGWARLAQGRPELILSLIEPSLLPMSHADYRSQVELLRAAMLARLDRVDQAKRCLDAIEPPKGRWWPLARAAVEGIVHQSDRSQEIERQIERDGIAHLVVRLALAALRPQGAHGGR